MNADRAIRVQYDALSRLKDCYSIAKTYKQTHAQLLESKQSYVYGQLPKGTPRHIREYVAGFDHALLEQTLRHDLIFGVWHDGQFYNHERGNPESVDARGMSYSDFANMMRDNTLEQGSYWRHDTTKPF
jgi:hypothetical protein